MEEKRLFELAKIWLVAYRDTSFGFYGSEADYDISDVWKNPNGDFHIEINYFENGKYYATSRTMPKEFALAKNREDALRKIGI
jgi:hypothetical protein